MPTSKAVLAHKREIDKLRSELARVHTLFDTIEVPRRVSGGAENAEAYDRLIWLIQTGTSRAALEELSQQRHLGLEAIDRLKKLAALYEHDNGPVTESQTHTYQIVRWVKEHLR